MTNVRFFKDVNCSKAFNGLAIFTDQPIKGRTKTGAIKRGWDGITAVMDGAGDGPYTSHPVRDTYLAECCTPITEEEAREMFPKLTKMVERARK